MLSCREKPWDITHPDRRAEAGSTMTAGETTTAYEASASVQRVHFGCSRCGACCNSAPQLSLPELFRHQSRFVGCLNIRRLPALEFAAGQSAAAELTAFLPRYAHRVVTATMDEYVSLTAQAYDDPLAAKCPALAPDKGCSLQDKGKPLACRSVPLEATLPDSFQLSVLGERARDAQFMGADCIQLQGGPNSGVAAGRRASTDSRQLPVIVEGTRVIDAESRHALELRRAALHLDRTHWGQSVFEMLRPHLFDQPNRVPAQGYLCLSLAPALSVISTLSNALTRRVVEYLNAQIELIGLTLGAPVAEPSQAQRELLGMLRANLNLRAKLQTARPLPEPLAGASEVEAWLLGQASEVSRG